METLIAVLGVVALACLIGNLMVDLQVRDRLDKIAGLLGGRADERGRSAQAQ